MADDDAVTARPGSYADLARRMDRMEGRHSDLEKIVERVELNQKHADDISKLRFDALDLSVGAQRTLLTDFMKRIEGIVTGEVQLPATRQTQEVLTEYQVWRRSIDKHIAEERELEALKKAEEAEGTAKDATSIAERAAAEALKTRLWVASVGGGIAVLVFIMNLFAPVLRHAVGLS